VEQLSYMGLFSLKKTAKRSEKMLFIGLAEDANFCTCDNPPGLKKRRCTQSVRVSEKTMNIGYFLKISHEIGNSYTSESDLRIHTMPPGSPAPSFGPDEVIR
jgi:hypothetical protein